VCCDIVLRALAQLNDVCELGVKNPCGELIQECRKAFNGAAVADLVEQQQSGE
jgi:hypothetical protein